MKGIIATFSVLLLAAACTPNTSDQSISQLLKHKLSSQDPIERHTACTIIASLPIPENDGEYGSEDSCDVFLRVKWQRSDQRIGDFLDLMAKDNEIKTLWSQHATAGYPVGFSPAQYDLLIQLAKTNNRALELLVNSIEEVDAGHREYAIDAVATLYQQQQERINVALQNSKLSQQSKALVVKAAKHES